MAVTRHWEEGKHEELVLNRNRFSFARRKYFCGEMEVAVA